MSPLERTARDHAESRGSKGTRRLYLLDLSRWLKWCGAHDADPARPGLAHATAYRDELRAAQKPLTVRRTLSALSSMYDAAISFETPLASWNPFKKLPRPPADDYARTAAISAVETGLIIAAATEDETGRDLALIRLLYDTGMRRASIAGMRRDAIVRRNGVTVVRVFMKGDREREVELSSTAHDALERWLKRSDPESAYVFPASRGRGHLHPATINEIVSRRAKQVGLEHIHPHSFRAAYVTNALDAGIPLHEVQASVHHRDPKTTLRYDRGQRGVGVAAAVEKFRRGG